MHSKKMRLFVVVAQMSLVAKGEGINVFPLDAGGPVVRRVAREGRGTQGLSI